jgi:hypothetical protein
LNESFASLSAILLNTTSLFEMELEGIRFTIPNFIQAIYRVLPNADSFPNIPKPNIEVLQKASYKLIGFIYIYVKVL